MDRIRPRGRSGYGSGLRRPGRPDPCPQPPSPPPGHCGVKVAPLSVLFHVHSRGSLLIIENGVGFGCAVARHEVTCRPRNECAHERRTRLCRDRLTRWPGRCGLGLGRCRARLWPRNPPPSAFCSAPRNPRCLWCVSCKRWCGSFRRSPSSWPMTAP